MFTNSLICLFSKITSFATFEPNVINGVQQEVCSVDHCNILVLDRFDLIFKRLIAVEGDGTAMMLGEEHCDFVAIAVAASSGGVRDTES